jgi:hypothetical protein
MSVQDYVAKAMTAAPEAIAKSATILAMEKDGAMRSLQAGTNKFTCMVLPDGTPMCTDEAGMEMDARPNESCGAGVSLHAPAELAAELSQRPAVRHADSRHLQSQHRTDCKTSVHSCRTP